MRTKISGRHTMTGRSTQHTERRLISASVCCRLCGRSAGDIVGYANQPLEETRFFPLTSDSLPVAINGHWRCAHCHGQLHLDDVVPLGRSVSLAEVGGPTFAQVLAGTRRSRRKPAA